MQARPVPRSLMMTTTTTTTKVRRAKAKAGSRAESGGTHIRAYITFYRRRDLLISGISVQNPNARGNVPGGRLVQDILRRAAECVVCDGSTYRQGLI